MAWRHHPHWPHAAAKTTLQWRHNERDCVSNHQPHDCLPNRWFGHRSKKTSKLRVTGVTPRQWTITYTSYYIVFLLEINLQTRHLAYRLDIVGPAWWRHQMETFSALLAFRAGNSPVTVNSPRRGQWRGPLMFSLIYAWTTGQVNNWDANDLRCHCA